MKRGGELVIGIGCAALAGFAGGALAYVQGFPPPSWLVILLLLSSAAFLIGRATA